MPRPNRGLAATQTVVVVRSIEGGSLDLAAALTVLGPRPAAETPTKSLIRGEDYPVTLVGAVTLREGSLMLLISNVISKATVPSLVLAKMAEPTG